MRSPNRRSPPSWSTSRSTRTASTRSTPRIEARGLDIVRRLRPRHARRGARADARTRNVDLAVFTTDALQQFLNEAGRHRLLHAAGGARAVAGASRRATSSAKERLTTHNLRLVVSIARRYQGLQRAVPARPHPGGHARPDPRRREVRPPQGLPLLHLRDAVDPPGDPARHRRQGPHHPPARPRRPARAQDRPDERALVGRRSAASRPRRRSPTAAELPLEQVVEMLDISRTVTSSTSRSATTRTRRSARSWAPARPSARRRRSRSRSRARPSAPRSRSCPTASA